MSYTANHLMSRLFVRMVEFDPDTGDATAVTLNPADSETYLALADNGAPKRYLFGVLRTVGTGGLTTVTVNAATAADGTGATEVAQITPTTADAVGDYVFVEVDADQIRAALATATHIGLVIDQVTAGDECVIIVIGSDGQHQYSGLTANYIS